MVNKIIFHIMSFYCFVAMFLCFSFEIVNLDLLRLNLILIFTASLYAIYIFHGQKRTAWIAPNLFLAINHWPFSFLYTDIHVYSFLLLSAILIFIANSCAFAERRSLSGAGLVGSLTEAQKNKIVTVAKFTNESMAILAKSALNEQGIEAFVDSPNSPLPLSSEVKLQVRICDLEKANDILSKGNFV